MKRRLGSRCHRGDRSNYDGRLPGFTDLVCYWFENGRALIEAGDVARVGFVATNSIRKNTNLPVMHGSQRRPASRSVERREVDRRRCYGRRVADLLRRQWRRGRDLNGKPVAGINPDLTTVSTSPWQSPCWKTKMAHSSAFRKAGRSMYRHYCTGMDGQPANPNGRRNEEVLKPYWNGDDLTGRPRDMSFIDLGSSLFGVGRNVSSGQSQIELAGEQVDDGLKVSG